MEMHLPSGYLVLQSHVTSTCLLKLYLCAWKVNQNSSVQQRDRHSWIIHPRTHPSLAFLEFGMLLRWAGLLHSFWRHQHATTLTSIQAPFYVFTYRYHIGHRVGYLRIMTDCRLPWREFSFISLCFWGLTRSLIHQKVVKAVSFLA